MAKPMDSSAEKMKSFRLARRPASKGNARISAGEDAAGFWDRPVLMNLVADLFFLLGGVLLIWTGITALQRLPVFPLTQVIVTQPLEQVSRSQLEHVAKTVFTGNFFTVNLEQAQAAFERLPWVRRAEVRRHWPDGIAVTLEEHRAAAKWTALEGEPRLVNARGEVFAGTVSNSVVLPTFSGPEGSADIVLRKYQEFSASLGTIGRRPVMVSLSPRQAWQVKLDDGALLDLGRDQAKHPLVERLNRFTANYLSASHRLPTVSVVDMRYPNGFALRAKNS